MPDYLTQVEEQLVALTEQGRHRRRRPRGLDAALLAVPVAVVVAIAVAVVSLGGAGGRRVVVGRHAVGRHVPSVREPAHLRPSLFSAIRPPANRTHGPAGPPTGGPVPPGFGPESFTAISEFTWWLLGSAPCSSPPCTSVVRTTDGGRTFVRIAAPPTSRVSQLRFANTLDGYAYGPQLWVTHNGGASWDRLRPAGDVDDLFASDGWVYAVVSLKDTSWLERSRVQSDDWSSLPVGGRNMSGLWAQEHDVMLNLDGSILVSHDRGQRFAVHRAPSGDCGLQSPAPPVTWVQCTTGSLSKVWRSSDGGRSFAATAAPLEPGSAALAAASSTTAVVGAVKAYRTTDGGEIWNPVRGLDGITAWMYLGFTDPTHGVALGYVDVGTRSERRLYYTTDGGASYHLVPIR